MAEKNPSTLLSVNLSLQIGAALALAVLLFTVGYALADDRWKAIIVFFGAAVAAAGQIAAAFYAARTLRLAVDVEERRLAVEQRTARTEMVSVGHEFGRRWTDASMFHIRKHFQEVLEKGMREKDTISDFIDADQSRRANVGNLLNFLEDLALSVSEVRCDEEVVKKLFCGIVYNIVNVTQPWITHQRLARARPQLWIEVENLHKRWSK